MLMLTYDDKAYAYELGKMTLTKTYAFKNINKKEYK